MERENATRKRAKKNGKRLRLDMATGRAVMRAYVRAINVLESDQGVTASQHSAGFVMASRQKRGARKGYQVFVRVCRFDEELLSRNRMTGGLLTP